MMTRNSLIALLFALVVGGTSSAAHADRKIVTVDYGIEASADTVMLPGSKDGSVVLTCATCAARSYRLADRTTYQIGKRSVTLKELAAYLHTAGSRSVTLFIKVNEPVVTRISVPGDSRSEASP